MITAILFDLDDTLLDNHVGLFMPRYLDLLGAFLAPRIDPENLGESLMAGTQAMFRNEDPELTLQQVFDAVFYPRIGIPRAELISDLDRFYRDEFPRLQELTRPVTDAARVVDLALQRQCKIAVATNPLFPLAAIEHRLHWAGLNLGKTPFDVITSYECMHFTKPHPEYVAEVLAHLVASPAESLFVGNDPDDDIAPAQRLGVATYWVNRDPSPEVVRGEGSLRQLAESLEGEEEEPAGILPAVQTPCSLPALLTGHLAALLQEFSESGWVCCPAEEGWAPVEIACHLRDVEREIMQPRLRLILDGENPFLPAVESDQWAEERGYVRQDGPQALRDFIAARKETIAWLRGLEAPDWKRTARHALFGPTTLEEQARFSARHDLLHIEQLQGSVAACHEKD